MENYENGLITVKLITMIIDKTTNEKLGLHNICMYVTNKCSHYNFKGNAKRDVAHGMKDKTELVYLLNRSSFTLATVLRGQ